MGDALSVRSLAKCLHHARRFSVEQRASGLDGEAHSLLGELLPVSSLNCTEIVLKVLVGRCHNPENSGRFPAYHMGHSIHPLPISFENCQAAWEIGGNFGCNKCLPLIICYGQSAGTRLPEHHSDLQCILSTHFAAEVGRDTHRDDAASQKGKREEQRSETEVFHECVCASAFLRMVHSLGVNRPRRINRSIRTRLTLNLKSSVSRTRENASVSGIR